MSTPTGARATPAGAELLWLAPASIMVVAEWAQATGLLGISSEALGAWLDISRQAWAQVFATIAPITQRVFEERDFDVLTLLIVLLIPALADLIPCDRSSIAEHLDRTYDAPTEARLFGAAVALAAIMLPFAKMLFHGVASAAVYALPIAAPVGVMLTRRTMKMWRAPRRLRPAMAGLVAAFIVVALAAPIWHLFAPAALLLADADTAVLLGVTGALCAIAARSTTPFLLVAALVVMWVGVDFATDGLNQLVLDAASSLEEAGEE